MTSYVNSNDPQWVQPFNPSQAANQQYQSVNPLLQQQQQIIGNNDVLAKPVDLSNDNYNDDAFGDFGNDVGGPSGISRIGG